MNIEELQVALARSLEDNRRLILLVEKLNLRIKELEAEVAALKARLLPDPATPSGAVPVYQKAPTRGRKKRPGRKKGHQGARRPTPENITRTEEHNLECCPECGGVNLKQLREPRTRIIEDVPPVPPEAVEHVIHRYRCADCKKIVEPVVTAALPGMQIGMNLLVQTAWLHCGLGMTVGSVVQYLNSLLQVKISPGGLTQMWARLAARLTPVYEELHEQAKAAPVLHADETGWRVDGKPWWLWAFTTGNLVFYILRRTRGAKVVAEVLGEIFDGVLCRDFFGSYNAVEAWAKQRCIVHLLREVKKVSLANDGDEWKAFRRRLKRLLTEALNWRRRRDELARAVYLERVMVFNLRLAALARGPYADKDAKRLAKRLRKYGPEIPTFLETDAPADNNAAERAIRPAVVMRKNSYGNMSDAGAHAQAVLMSVFRTLRMRGEDPVAWVKKYLQESLSAKKPPLKRDAAA